MIDGVRLIELRRIPDARGTIYHMLRCDDEHYSGFGEIYFSSIYPAVVKAWHLHDRMTLRYAVPIGMVQVVLYDAREGSPSRGEVAEVCLGEDAYRLLVVPPGIWNGFRCLGPNQALLANCPDIPHDPTEIHRIDSESDAVPYRWR